jgi:dihydrolipoamide dehydrogenase
LVEEKGLKDTIVIGSGPGGYVAAIHCAQMGQSVTIIEMGDIGGVCTNSGCIPTKTLLESAKLIREIKRSGRRGLSFSGLKIDFSKAMRHKDQVVSRNSKGVEYLLRENKVETVVGKGYIIDKNKVMVEKETGSDVLETEHIVIATGSKERELPNIRMDGERILGSEQLLNIKELPSSLLIIGGGAIGVEVAQIFSSFGTKVTIIELMYSILPMEDDSIGKVLTKVLKRGKVEIHTSSKVEKVETNDSGVKAFVSGEEDFEMVAEKVLLSVGRVPVIEEEVIGPDVEYDKRGIKVDERMQTSIPNIYAIGDVTGKVMLAHVASQQAEVAADNICGIDSTMDYSLVPSCIYTDPEVASFGLSVRQARDQYGDITIGEFPMSRSGRGRTSGVTEGFARIISQADNEEILGAQIVAPRATDMLELLLLAKEKGIPISEVARIIYPHPTYIEMVREAAIKMKKRDKCRTDDQARKKS